MEQLRDITNVSRSASNARSLILGASHFGLTLKAVRTSILSLGRFHFPLIAYTGFRHYVVIERIDGQWAYLNDPHLGRAKQRLQRFKEVFTGIALVTDEAAPSPQRSLARLSLTLARLNDVLKPARGGLAAVMALSVMATMALALGMTHAFSATGRGATHLETMGLLCITAFASAMLALQVLAGIRVNLGQGAAVRLLEHMVGLGGQFFVYRLPRSLHGLVNDAREIGDAVGNLTRRAGRLLSALLLLVYAGGAAHPGLSLLLVLLALGYTAVATLLRRQAELYRKGPLCGDPAASVSIAATFSQVDSYRTGRLEAALVDEMAEGNLNGNNDGQFRVRLDAVESALSFLTGGMALVCGAYTAPAQPLVPALIAVAFGFLRGMGGLAEDWRAIRDLTSFAEDILGIEPAPPVATTTAPADITCPLGVRIQNVTFGYSHTFDADVEHISLDIPAGATIGMTGRTGCGKSTIAGLLAGLHRPWSGAVFINDRPIAHWPTDLLADRIALVDKVCVLFEGTVRDNLRLWDESLSDAQLWRAACDAGIADELSRRGAGLDCPVADQGANFSGGQRQRLEIARALVREPRLLIMDEASDALEPELEKDIVTNIRRRGCTIVLITHRIESLSLCDRVIALSPTSAVDVSVSTLATTAARVPGIAPAPIQQDVREEAVPEEVVRQNLAQEFARVTEVALGRRIEEPAGLQYQSQLRAACEDVGLYCRHIDLGRGDSRFDLTPFIGFDKASGRAMAVTSAHQLDAMPELERDAYLIYPTYDDGPVTARQRFRVAFAGARRDAMRIAGLSLALATTTLAGALALTTYTRSESSYAMATALAAVLAFAPVAIIRDVLVTRLFSRAGHQAIAAFWVRFLKLPLAFIKQHGAIELDERLRTHAQTMRAAVSASRSSWSIAVLFALLPVLFWLSPAGALGAAIVVGLSVAATGLLTIRLSQVDEARRRLSLIHRNRLLELLFLCRKLRSLRHRMRGVAVWQRALDAETALIRTKSRWSNAADALVDLLPLLTITGAMAGMALSNAGSHGSTVTLLFVVAAGLAARGAASATRCTIEALSQQHAIVKTLSHATEQECLPRRDPTIALCRARFNGCLTVRNLRIRHAGQIMPRHPVSFAVDTGQVLVVTGRSGTGKSTLLRALLNMLPVADGDVIFDGVPLAGWDIIRLRAQLGAVWQSDEVWEGSVRDNVTGGAEYTLDQVWLALDAAGLAEEIAAMSRKVDTLVAEYLLSSGQKQRLLLARQLIRKPRLLILDEATNAVDAVTEARIFSLLRQSGTTCIVAAHRESTLRHADVIVDLETGEHSRQQIEIVSAPSIPRPDVATWQRQAMTRPGLFRQAPLKRFLSGRQFDGPRLLARVRRKETVLAALLWVVFAATASQLLPVFSGHQLLEKITDQRR